MEKDSIYLNDGLIEIKAGGEPVLNIEKLKGILPLAEKIPVRYIKTSFDMERYFKIINEKKSYIFFGSVGVGKTFMMQEIANAFALEDYGNSVMSAARYSTGSYNIDLPLDFRMPRIYTTSEISKSLKGDFDSRIGKENLLDKLVKANVVFVDDLGVENVTDWWLEQFGYLINERYNYNRPMVLSTNLGFKSGDFAKFYGDRIASRLVEMCEFVHVTGEDRRFKK